MNMLISTKRTHNIVIGVIRTMKTEVEEALKEIQPHLRADGGDIELVDVDEEGTVKVKLKGACAGCPMSQMTLQLGVERYLKKKIPQVKKVVSV
jgi:Fe-S cluster biogenesis protein NfuA